MYLLKRAEMPSLDWKSYLVFTSHQLPTVYVMASYNMLGFRESIVSWSTPSFGNEMSCNDDIELEKLISLMDFPAHERPERRQILFDRSVGVDGMGNSLVINDAKEEDEGNYTCKKTRATPNPLFEGPDNFLLFFLLSRPMCSSW